MPCKRSPWSSIAFLILMSMSHEVFLFTSMSRASCLALIPFLAFRTSAMARNHFCISTLLLWKIVPTVALKDVLQLLQWYRLSLGAAVILREAVRALWCAPPPHLFKMLLA